MPQYRNGQTVRYKPVGGPESRTSESVGFIRSVLTEPGNQAHRNVDASEDQPRYEIENQNTGRVTTIYEKNILDMA
ncbi:hypothetical protein E8E15_005071 [Penicillium rubens]|uniref:Pc20g14780 protein n=2 Tax=Penicillium chrysogenum species complex TaxID=254878 RepID=B6HDT5_PENRW|nr:uncharacterized protein N7525_009852 [Penicillium rubens]KAJ5260266.1 hypothetical protein N7505_009647 [Penicillium chrysogenum]CAP86807.1 Pc20g14780 [Penicillium rubens Wisconsin 54-1255]KAF3015476.1 hypothetical protein E8E15_005071 [Penicillium rubens]KAJ5053082.1 hypothetical protein NUH16_010142 [Penicillium rubens]KAJ5831599.1 hypothetical protein N7525_009852 [Penicillium rubens]